MKEMILLIIIAALSAAYWFAPAHVIFQARCAVAKLFTAPPIVLANMDIGAAAAIERLTGRAYFTAAGATSAIDLGNIQMHKLDYGVKRKEHYKNKRGGMVMDRDDAYGTMPKFTIEGDEFTSAVMPLLFAGTANADATQALATAATVVVTSKKGYTFDLGAYGLTNASVTTPTTKVEGPTADYVIDRANGKIYFPSTSSIADATSVTVTFDKPAATFDSVNAFDTLNRLGTLQVIEEDSFSLIPKTIYNFACSLSVDSAGDTKPEDYKKFSLIATITSTFTVLKRKS
jgi:hypothetical protein